MTPRGDLTRWNRAGLKQLAYVDGDASVWLEEVRLALLGLYLRGQPVNQRQPDFWRDHFMQADPDDWITPADQASLAAALPWDRLMPVRPPESESRGRRSRRLLAQYDESPSGDQTWEIVRAFSRSAHVVLGHIDAHAGEGYLRTATQWDNLRRLAAMVNYHPGPPASAATLIALELAADAGTVDVAKGLAARHAPPEGGLPLTFETLAPLMTHPDLNAARPRGWNRPEGPLATRTGMIPLPVRWLAGSKLVLAAGALAVLEGTASRQAVTMAESRRNGPVIAAAPVTAGDQTFGLADTRLWVLPEDVRVGLERSDPPGREGIVRSALLLDRPVPSVAGDVVAVLDPGTKNPILYARVLSQKGRRLRLAAEQGDLPDEVLVRPMARIGFSDVDGYGKWVSAPDGTTAVWFTRDGEVAVSAKEGNHWDEQTVGGTKRQLFRAGFATEAGFLDDPGTAGVTARLERAQRPVTGAASAVEAPRLATFAGKPPKRLAPGSLFAARPLSGGTSVALEVLALSVGADSYTVEFDDDLPGAPEATEFHGPLTEALPALGHDRNPDELGSPRVVLAGLAPEADALLKPGRRLILSRLPFAALQDDGSEVVTPGDETDAVIAAVDRTDPAFPVLILTPARSIDAWPLGDTVLRLNAVPMGHGESKGSLLMGSGDAERIEQSFRVDVEEIAHITSSASTTGVVPDIDIAVDGLVWPWRDYRDVAADGARAWSSTMTEDGRLMVHFRRRLPTGTNNISVLRHRVGTGARGTGVPPFSLKEPAKKHLHVARLVQPFATAGGADRESVASLRINAPAHLAANGRAVSARDFERLATAQAAIWRARAEEVPDGGALRRLRLTVVPAYGGTLTPDQIATLRPTLLAFALPGVRLDLVDYRPLHLSLAAEVRADLLSHDAGDVKAACEAALRTAFGLEARDFAQPAYASEVMAVLETVPSVETVLVTGFALNPASAPGTPAHAVDVDAAAAAIFPHPDQVLFLPPGQGITLTVRGLT